MTDPVDTLLAQARGLASTGQDEEAKAAYLEILRRDETHFAALNELGTLAFASDHLSAAHTAYRQAVHHHPGNPLGRVNLGNLLYKRDDFTGALAQFEAALAAEPEFVEAHQGLARTLTELGHAAAAEPHWQKGFAGHAMVVQSYRGSEPAVPVLLLVSARGGNIPTQYILDNRIFAVVALYADFYDPAQKLPPHTVVFNAIGDADLCDTALAGAEAVLARTSAPVINPPGAVRATGRVANARRLAGLPGVVVPSIESMSRSAIASAAGLSFPLLVRAPGYHTGQHFRCVEHQTDLAAAVAALPGEEILLLEYLDARGAAGMARKYRVMIVDGVLYPLHLAISAGWKVHYFTADMAADAAYREEEQRFLDDMAAVLGTEAVSALAAISRCLGLDYGGIDFGIGRDGAVLLFEANATMVVTPPDDDPTRAYRRAPIGRVLEAVRAMVLARAAGADRG